MKKTWLIAVALLGLCGSVPANAAPIGSGLGLVGDTVDAAMIRTIPDPYYGFGRICCHGLDAPFQVADGTADQKNYGSSFLLNVDNLSFDIDFLSAGGWQRGIVLRLSGLNFLPGQVLPFDLDIDTNIAGMTWSVGADYVDIHMDSIVRTSASYIRGSFNVTAIPEPEVILLLLTGLVALCGLSLARLRTAGSEARTGFQ